MPTAKTLDDYWQELIAGLSNPLSPDALLRLRGTFYVGAASALEMLDDAKYSAAARKALLLELTEYMEG